LILFPYHVYQLIIFVVLEFFVDVVLHFFVKVTCDQIESRSLHFLKLLRLLKAKLFLRFFIAFSFVFLQLLFFYEALDSVDLDLLLLDCFSELKDVRKVLELYFAVKNQGRLPDQVAESLVSLHNFFSPESFSKLLYRDVAFFNAIDVIYTIKKLLKVYFYFAFVLFQLLVDNFLVVQENLG